VVRGFIGTSSVAICVEVDLAVFGLRAEELLRFAVVERVDGYAVAEFLETERPEIVD